MNYGYRLWDPVNHKMIRSKDVIFNEFKVYKRLASDMEVKKTVDRFI